MKSRTRPGSISTRPSVVKRPRHERKRLAPEFEALARGEKLRRPSPRKPKRDDQPGRAIPGVTNFQARVVYDARVNQLRALIEERRVATENESDKIDLAIALLESIQLGLWRGRRIVNFDTFSRDVLGIDSDEARLLAQTATAAKRTPLEQLDDASIAMWIKIEAALLEQKLHRTRVHMTNRNGIPMLHLDVPLRDVDRVLRR